MVNREKNSVLILGASSDIGINLINKLIKKNYFIIAHYNSNKKKLTRFLNDKVKIIKSNFSLFNDKNLKKLSKEIKKYNVFINNLRLGLINSKIHKKLKRNKKEINNRLSLIPANRNAEPSEMANYILFFISENNSFLTRETISISGGE